MSCYVTWHLSVARPGNDLFHQQRVWYCLPNPSSRRHAQSFPSLAKPIVSTHIIDNLAPSLPFPSLLSIRVRFVFASLAGILESRVSFFQLTKKKANREYNSIIHLKLPILTQISPQIPPTISTRWPESNASPARRSAERYPHTPLNTTTPAHAKPRSRTKTTVNRVPASK